MKISACVITKNEEKNIARSILSYKDAVDEIIVVDSESTDDTVKIAESLGATVYTRPWTNDFAAARNYAIDKASGDWIMIMDADEYFADGHGSVKGLIEQAQREGKEAISPRTYEVHRGSEDVCGITHIIKFFKNNGRMRYKNRIHEILHKLGKEDIATMMSEDFIVYHTGYDPEMIDEKLSRNLLHLQFEKAMENDFFRHFYMAECYSGLKKHEECIEELSHVFGSPDFEELLYGGAKVFRAYAFQVTSMLMRKQNYSEKEIFKYVKNAIDGFGKHPEIRFLAAAYHEMYYRIEEAIQSLEEAFRMQEVYDKQGIYGKQYENTFRGGMEKAYKCLADFYKMKGDFKSARHIAFDRLCKEKDMKEWMTKYFVLLHGMETKEKYDISEKLFDIEDSNDLIKFTSEAWLSGNHDLFTIWLLSLLKKHPELAADHGILCKIHLLQRNDASILDIASHHAGESMYDNFALAAKLAVGEHLQTLDFAQALPAFEELLRVGAYEEAERSMLRCMNENADETDSIKIGIISAQLFSKYGRYRQSGAFYLKAAHRASGGQAKGAQYVNAAHTFYLAGEIEAATDILKEALPFAIPGNHLPIEILGWICEQVGEKDQIVYHNARRLRAEYEIQYDLTYDKPLPDCE